MNSEPIAAQGPVDGTVMPPPGQPRLTVRLVSFAESNGKRNWTALLVRAEPWDGLIGNCGGITVARGELWNRVAYEAERTKFLIGELNGQIRDTRVSSEQDGRCEGNEVAVDRQMAER